MDEALSEMVHFLSSSDSFEGEPILEIIGRTTDAKSVYFQRVPTEGPGSDFLNPDREKFALLTWTNPADRNDYDRSEHSLEAESDRSMASSTSGNDVAVPVLSPRGTFFGFLGVMYGEKSHPWKTEDRLILDVFGHMLAAHMERENAQKKVEQSEQRWRSLVEAHPEPILVLVRDKIKYANPSGVQVFGAQALDELFDRPLSDFISAADQDSIEEELLRNAETTRSEPLQHEVTRLDGEWRIVESIAVSTIYDGELATQIILRDVTERKKTEERYRTFIETTSEGIWRLELDKPVETATLPAIQADHIFEHAFLAECNAVMAQILGKEGPEQSIGLRCNEFLPNAGIIKEFVESGYSLRNREFSLMGKWPRHFMLNVQGTIERGRLVRIWGSCIDVSERVELERRMVSALEEQQQSIGRELHDGVGQLLTGVRMLSQALEERLDQIDSDELDLARRIVHFADQASQQVRSIYSRTTPVQLEHDGLVSAIDELVRNTDGLPDIRCASIHEGGVEIADPEARLHLYRIVQEAVNNALKHARASTIDVLLDAGKDEIRLEVRDNGIGMSGKAPGSSSIGLKSMRYRAHAIGARLEIQSESGKGTVVRCVLPAAGVYDTSSRTEK
jgi:PAS domain S-box-containing protein